MSGHSRFTNGILSGFMTAAMSMAGIALPANDAEASNPKQGQGQQAQAKVPWKDFRNKTAAEVKEEIKKQSLYGPLVVAALNNGKIFAEMQSGLTQARDEGATVRGILLVSPENSGLPVNHHQVYAFNRAIYERPISCLPLSSTDAEYYRRTSHRDSEIYNKAKEGIKRDILASTANEPN